MKLFTWLQFKHHGWVWTSFHFFYQNNKQTKKTVHLKCIIWFVGSISYLGKMLGSLTCGFASEYFGRRNAMILISIPHLLAFYLFYYSTSIWKVFVANSLLGFGSGYVKAPSITYITEIRWINRRIFEKKKLEHIEVLINICFFDLVNNIVKCQPEVF